MKTLPSAALKSGEPAMRIQDMDRETATLFAAADAADVAGETPALTA